MDTTETYIKMNREAKEIQKLWKPQEGDKFQGIRGYYSGKFENRIETFSDCSDPYYGSIPDGWESIHDGEPGWSYKTQSIWLPRQDQLQEMLGEHGLQTICAEIYQFSTSEYGSRFAMYGSMEQLWLAFVMKEKFGKRWTGKTWEKIK